MARFNTASHQARPAVANATSSIATISKTADTRTFEGAPGWTRTPKAAAFLLATGALLDGKGTFYESGEERDKRLTELAHTTALEDPVWCLDFVRWMRREGNIRTAAIVFAAEVVKARLDAGTTGGPRNRQIIDAALRRPDEPGELLAYWTSRYGRSTPKPVKRGVADAVRRLYNERALLKYDTASHGYRFGDVLNLVHAAPDPGESWQGDLFQYALDRRHNPDTAVVPESLPVLAAHRHLMALPAADRRKVVTGAGGVGRLAGAGITWEALAGWLQGPMDKVAWEAMIPSMGVMALVRNLRNFDQAGVSDEVAERVIDLLTDPHAIAKSRQFPFRFLAAYRATKDEGSLRWAYPLEQALNHSLVNVPCLGGRTLILVDRSPSMFPEYDHLFPKSKISIISRADQAALFGAALAVRAENPTLVEFHKDSREIPVRKGTSVLPLVEAFGKDYGTDIPSAVRKHYDNHDRVVILTDEQTQPGYLPSNTNARVWGEVKLTSVDALVPLDVPVFMWNFAGYVAGAMPSGSNARFTLGGLTDSAFRLIPMLEAGSRGVWPWQAEPAA